MSASTHRLIRSNSTSTITEATLLYVCRTVTHATRGCILKGNACCLLTSAVAAKSHGKGLRLSCADDIIPMGKLSMIQCCSYQSYCVEANELNHAGTIETV